MIEKVFFSVIKKEPRGQLSAPEIPMIPFITLSIFFKQSIGK